jgi:hypothetical protein
MAAAGRDIVAYETDLARRLDRLFRGERNGRLARRPPMAAERLLERRGQLIAALIRADATRRALLLPVSADLSRAAEALWRETGLARRCADARLDQLRADLLMSRGEGIPSGIRGVADRRVIGWG